MNINHDGKLAIAIGRSRYEEKWQNIEVYWSDLLGQLANSRDTGETREEYLAMDEKRQADVKDIGGFVGGYLDDGIRKIDHVRFRQVVTLDLDTAKADIWGEIMDEFKLDCAMALYSTHKHSLETPRFRLVVPLDRTVTPDEYEAIARKIAEKVGLGYCGDATTFRVNQLMYWPSHPADCAPVFEYYDAEWLSADAVLAEYGGNWKDVSRWPRLDTESWGFRRTAAMKQADPETKGGIVGAFCRTYDVQAAIDKYLPGVYISTGRRDRMTYAKGSTCGGLVLYDRGKFAYSNHSTDPANNQLCNAFDLVRIHLFGSMDAPGESGGKAESYRRMCDLAMKDEAVCATLAADEKASAVLGYGAGYGEERDPGEPPDEDGTGGGDDGDCGDPPASGPAPDPMAWEQKLERDKGGKVKPSVTNAVLIISEHPMLQCVKYNELTHAIEVHGKLPWDRPNKYWSEMDDAQLYVWIADNYKVQFPETQYRRAMLAAVDKRRFSPLKDRLKALPRWDGTPRIDRMLCEYFDAPDTPYTHAVTRASMIGAVKRVMEPGCKHDNVLVLDGKQGYGKSSFIAKLAGEFFSDSLKLTDMKDKAAAEKLQGVWIMEIGEMQGHRKADMDCVKGFISCQVDRYRPSYGRVVEQFPRSTVIWGTTNTEEDGFLRDLTGNRRFWPVKIRQKTGNKSIWADLTGDEVDQIWAEALEAYKSGEHNYLTPEMELEAQKAQQEALVSDDREGLVIDYLNTPIPDDFYSWTQFKRADYFADPKRYEKERQAAKTDRPYISPVEIWVECFGRPLNQWDRKCSYDIAAIMARIPGWVKNGERHRIDGYGLQRVYSRV